MFLRRAILTGVLGALLGVPPVALALQAPPPTPPPQVRGAIDGAVTNLLNGLSTERLTSDLTVGEFLRRTSGSDRLATTLERGELIGGPRWIDAQTCQVQLEISGPRVAAALKQIAADEPKTSPLPPEAFDRLASHWRNREFIASGSSTSASPGVELRPRLVNGAWAHVRNEDCVQALTNARRDAVQRILESLRPVHLGKGTTVGDLLDNPDLRHAMEEWLSLRPITHAEFRRDLQVEIDLSATPAETLEALRARLAVLPPHELARLDVPAPEDEAAWARLRNAFEMHMAVPEGRAAVASDVVNHHLALPAHAPNWVDDQAEEIGAATRGDSKLKAALRAEARAREKLRARIESLALSSSLTVGQAAGQDPRIGDCVSRAVARARIVDTNYNDPSGSVAVRVSMDLHDFWDDLRSAP